MTLLAVTRAGTLLWVILPYLAIATFVVGHIWRWRRDQFTWTTRSTQLLESRLLKLGSPLFHLGLLAVIGGHVIGILVPQSVTEWLGVYKDTWGAGLHIRTPFVERISRKVSLKEEAADFPPQPVITRDNVRVRLGTAAPPGRSSSTAMRLACCASSCTRSGSASGGGGGSSRSVR